MSHYVGTKTSCEAYSEKVGSQLQLNGNRTSRWSDIRRHPAKSLFSVVAHARITPDEGASLKLVETLTPDWNETEQP